MVPPPTQIGAVGIRRDVHAAGAAEHRALAGDVRRASRGRCRSSHCASEALRLPVTGSSTAAPSFGKNARTSKASGEPSRVRADDAEVELAEARARARAPPRRSRAGRATQPGPVVDPLRVEDLAARRCRGSVAICIDELLVDGPERRSGGAANASPAPMRRTGISPARALLHDHVVALRRAAAEREPGVARAERRVAREGQLEHRREDAHPVVGLGLARRQHERRLGEVRPVREALHLLVLRPVAVEHDGDRVACVGVVVKTSTCANGRSMAAG